LLGAEDSLETGDGARESHEEKGTDWDPNVVQEVPDGACLLALLVEELLVNLAVEELVAEEVEGRGDAVQCADDLGSEVEPAVHVIAIEAMWLQELEERHGSKHHPSNRSGEEVGLEHEEDHQHLVEPDLPGGRVKFDRALDGIGDISHTGVVSLGLDKPRVEVRQVPGALDARLINWDKEGVSHQLAICLEETLEEPGRRSSEDEEKREKRKERHGE